MTPKQEIRAIVNGIAKEARENGLEEAAQLCETNGQKAMAIAIRNRKSSTATALRENSTDA